MVDQATAPRQINLGTPEDATNTFAPSPAAPTQAPVGTQANPHKDQTNAPASRERDFEVHSAAAKKFGTEDGKGKKAFVSWARDLVDGGAEGVLTAGGISQDASKLYSDFMGASQSASAKVLSEDNNRSEAVQISKVKAFIKLGNRYKDTALTTFDKARGIHAQLVGAKKEVRYKSTYTALVKVATEQCKKLPHPTDPTKKADRDPLTEAELNEILVAPEVEAKVTTGADLLIHAMNMIQHAINGRPKTDNREGRDPITHTDLPVINAELRRVIGEVDPASLAADDAEKAAIVAKKEAAAKKKAETEATKKAKAEAEANGAGTETDNDADEDTGEIPQDLMDELDTDAE